MRLWILCSVLLALAGCYAPDPTPHVYPRGPMVRPHGKPQLLLFTQEHCPACRFLEQQLRDPAVRDETAHYDLVEVRPPDARFAEYNVRETPVLIAVNHAGSHRYPGGTLGQLRLWLSQHHGHQQEPPPEAVIGKISEGGPTSPDGKVSVVCDLPASERKKNIASKGLGCCVFRAIEYAARWQQVPELLDLPEQMVKAGIAGGGYPQKVDEILKRFGPSVEYVQDTSGDPAILEAILATGRMPCVTYNGHDGVHYSGNIAHMVCLPYFNRQTGWACVSDNNFPEANRFAWMTCGEFLQRWRGGGGGGWVVALLAAPPPPCPRN